MVVGVAIAELHIPLARSLKEKRRVVRSLRDRMTNRLPVSVAEVAMQDLHQRARFGIAFVSSDSSRADATFESVRSLLQNETEAVLAGWTTELLEFDADVGLGVSGFEFGEME
jgi:uncharacterized protein